MWGVMGVAEGGCVHPPLASLVIGFSLFYKVKVCRWRTLEKKLLNLLIDIVYHQLGFLEMLKSCVGR